MTQKYTGKEGRLRLYDSTATPYYLEIDFCAMDFSGPSGFARQDEVLVLDRGRMNARAHYIKGADDKVMEPLSISFSCMLTDSSNWTLLKDWLDAMNDGGTTTVNSQTVATTKGDTQRDGANANPAFADSNKLCCNVEILFDGSTADRGMVYNEVYFPKDQCTISEAEDGVTMAFTGLVYGTVSDITAFTAGTDIET